MTRPVWLAIAIAFLPTFLAGAAEAIFLEPSIRDFVHTAWTQHEGIPLASVLLLDQTSDGYLWLSSGDEGLLRFDGVRFVPLPSPCGTRISAARGDGAEGLWLDCDYHLYHHNALGHTVAIQPNPLPSDIHSTGYFTDSRRRLWFWGRSLGWVGPDGVNGEKIHGLQRAANESPARIVEDRDGAIWFSGRQGLFRIQGNESERVFTGYVSALAPSPAGGIDILTETAILRAQNGSVSTLVTFPRGINGSAGPSLVETASGIWFGTRNQGVALFRHGKISTFSRRDGLSSDTVLSMKGDREGNIWVGTALGLHRFREPLAYPVPQESGLPPGMPSVVFRDSRNGFWFGTDKGICRVDQGSGVTQVWSGLYPAIGESGGRVWLATRDQIGYVERGKLVPAPADDGKPVESVSAFRRDSDGNFWALSPSGLYRIEGRRPKLTVAGDFGSRFLVSAKSGMWIAIAKAGLLHIDHDRRTVFGPRSAIAEGVVLALTEEGDSIWVGTREGLSRWRNGQWTTWTPSQGLPGRGVFEITADAQHRLWLMTYGGILALDTEQLAGTPDGHPGTLSYFRIGMLDRVMPHRGGVRYSPRVASGLDGRLYFDTLDSVAVVDPARIAGRSFAPRVIIEEFLVNRRPVAMGENRPLIRPEDLQFEYTSLSLRAPENVRFRYKLEGYDKDWVDAGGQRRASYGSLRPGSYRFRVIGYGGEGVWNSAGAGLAFRIEAPYYERTPFLLLSLSAIAALLWMAHGYRLRLEAERVRLRVEAQGNERLRIAQEMHDTFLQGIHGSQLMVGAAVHSIDTQPWESRRLLQRALELIGDSTERARETVSSLRSRPVEPRPFVARLQRMADEEAALSTQAPKISVDSQGTPRELLPEVEEHIYHIASEALRNAVRHARASLVSIKVLFASDDFQLLVKDDGIGIARDIQQNGKQNHFGLTGMRERAGSVSGVLRIQSADRIGTEVLVTLFSSHAYRATSQ